MYDKELKTLEGLLEKYKRYGKIRDSKSGSPTEYNYKSLGAMINDCFIEEAFYLKPKIEDMIFFLNELKDLDSIGNDKRSRLRHLYETEYQLLKSHLKIYDDNTKTRIEKIIHKALEPYIGQKGFIFGRKEFILVRDIISEFREYERAIWLANILKKCSPFDSDFKALKHGLNVSLEYAKEINNNHLTFWIERELSSFDGIEVTKENRKILDSFDGAMIGVLIRYFSDDVVKTKVGRLIVDWRVKNLKERFYKENKQSKKWSNKLKDKLVKELKGVEVSYIF